ncbi:MAG: 7-carboxy-7-deazaguanine synthase QueE [Chlamydiales bacterium]
MDKQSDQLTLNMIEVFHSVQGETSLSGYPTTFVRLAACNLRCSWCDTPYSFGRGESTALETIIDRVEFFGAKHVCITGGEPLLQSNVHHLMRTLCTMGFVVSIETGGSLPIEDIDSRVKVILDIKCPGSKMCEKNRWENLQFLKENDEVKFVVINEEDYQWALQVCKEHQLFNHSSEILFSPVHNVMDAQLLVRWILRDKIPVRLNLQIHKFIWTPETIGV